MIAPVPSATLTSRAATTWRGTVRAELVGFRIAGRETLEDGRLRLPLAWGDGIRGASLRIELAADDWGLFTDVAVRVLDGDGEPVVSDGMGYRILRTGHRPGEPFEGTLAIDAAFADPDGVRPVPVDVERTYLLAEPIAMSIEDSDELELFPDRPRTLSLAADRLPPALPEGAVYVLRLAFTPEDARMPELALELTAGP